VHSVLQSAEHSQHKREHTYFTDSGTVLSWLTLDPRNFYAFVMHRLGEILEITKLKVVDMATQFIRKPNSQERINGPLFLQQSKDQWPKQPTMCPSNKVDHDEIRKTVLIIRKESIVVVPLYVERFSDWKRLYRATATFLLYLDIHRARCKADKIQKMPTLEQLTSAKNLLFMNAQQDHFKSELETLQSNGFISKPSVLIELNIYIDSDGIMRTQGRSDTIN